MSVNLVFTLRRMKDDSFVKFSIVFLEFFNLSFDRKMMFVHFILTSESDILDS